MLFSKSRLGTLEMSMMIMMKPIFNIIVNVVIFVVVIAAVVVYFINGEKVVVQY